MQDIIDIVISINTIHNLEKDECAQALREITRVSKEFFITDAYRSEEEKKIWINPQLKRYYP